MKPDGVMWMINQLHHVGGVYNGKSLNSKTLNSEGNSTKTNNENPPPKKKLKY